MQEKLEKMVEYFNCVFNSIPYPEEDFKLFDSFDFALNRQGPPEKLELLRLGLQVFLNKFDHTNGPVLFENVSKYHFVVFQRLFWVSESGFVNNLVFYNDNKGFAYYPKKWLREAKIQLHSGGIIEVPTELAEDPERRLLQMLVESHGKERILFIVSFNKGTGGTSELFMATPSVLNRQYATLKRTGSCVLIEFLSNCDSRFVFNQTFDFGGGMLQGVLQGAREADCGDHRNILLYINNYLDAVRTKFRLIVSKEGNFELHLKKYLEAYPMKVPYKGYLIHFLDLYTGKQSQITDAIYSGDMSGLKEELEKFKQISGEVCFASMKPEKKEFSDFVNSNIYLLFYGEAEKSYPEDVDSYLSDDKKTRNIALYLPADFSRGRAVVHSALDEHFCIPSKLKFIGIGAPDLQASQEELFEKHNIPYINRDADALIDFFKQKNLSCYVMKDLSFVKGRK